jgi:hypothetical protein
MGISKLSPRRLALYAILSSLASVVIIVGPLTSLVRRDLTPSWLESFLSAIDFPPSQHDQRYLEQYTPLVPSKELQSRLQNLLRAPLWSSREAYRKNVVGCPLKVANRQANPDQLWRCVWFWKQLKQKDIVWRRIAIVKYLEDVARNGFLSSTPFSGRGIVMTGGNKATNPRFFESCISYLIPTTLGYDRKTIGYP